VLVAPGRPVCSLSPRPTPALAIVALHVCAHSVEVGIAPESDGNPTDLLNGREIELSTPHPAVKSIPTDLEFLRCLCRGVSSHKTNNTDVYCIVKSSLQDSCNG
jgi:hypothetical protein